MRRPSLSRAVLVLVVGVLAVLALSCNEFEDPPPLAPIVVPNPPSRFDVLGHWEGITDQGRPIRFDVTESTVVINGAISLHHDCSGGRLVLPLLDFQAPVEGDSFTATMIWRRDEPNRYYAGKLTVSGRFESDSQARGGFVNSVTDKVVDNLGTCGGVSGFWEVVQ